MKDRIETPRLVLRKAVDADLDAIWHNVWSDETLAETMLWTPTLTREEALARLERTKNHQAENYGFFVCRRDTDEPIGFGGVREISPGEYDETGLCIARQYQRRGYGKEMLTALIELVFGELGGSRFHYSCFHNNDASAALCRGCGFVFTHSEPARRERDGLEYLCDHYVLERKNDSP
ncbi:MAG: GNAT family N-acetyltransferase [Oscillospiraceae bacterium]|nr:GNAT family N-acetyltransferase [Oscillospiraceae bacterium]